MTVRENRYLSLITEPSRTELYHHKNAYCELY